MARRTVWQARTAAGPFVFWLHCRRGLGGRRLPRAATGLRPRRTGSHRRSRFGRAPFGSWVTSCTEREGIAETKCKAALARSSLPALSTETLGSLLPTNRCNRLRYGRATVACPCSAASHGHHYGLGTRETRGSIRDVQGSHDRFCLRRRSHSDCDTQRRLAALIRCERLRATSEPLVQRDELAVEILGAVVHVERLQVATS